VNPLLNTPPPPYVITVDDDPGMLKSIDFLLQTEKLRCHTFSSGGDLFDKLLEQPELLNGPGCILLDVRMPDMSGLEVFDKLIALDQELNMPVIFITAHGDVALVTKVLKQGAVDFISKPFSAEDLLLRLHQYFEISRTRYISKANKIEVLGRIAELTERELFVMEHLFEGLSNKEIAELLGNSVRTIELRRAAIYDKLNVKGAVELARLLDSVDWKR
jgi:FixJ family two-component response regulator